jgi:hypothetical protein
MGIDQIQRCPHCQQKKMKIKTIDCPINVILPIDGELPVSFACNGDVSNFSNIVSRVSAAEENLTSIFRVVDVSADNKLIKF